MKNKLLFLGLLLLGLLAVSKVHADETYEGFLTGRGKQFVNFDVTGEASTATAVSGSGTLYKIIASTGALPAYFVLMDTVAASATLASYTTGQRMTPKLGFTSTTTVAGGVAANSYDFGEIGGVRFRNGLGVFTSGAAGNSIGLYYIKQ